MTIRRRSDHHALFLRTKNQYTFTFFFTELRQDTIINIYYEYTQGDQHQIVNVQSVIPPTQYTEGLKLAFKATRIMIDLEIATPPILHNPAA